MGIFEQIGRQIGGAIDDAVDAVSDAVGAATEAATGAVTGAVGAVGGAVSGAAGAVVGVGSRILKAIPAQVEAALNVLQRHQNIVQEQINAPLRAMVGQVTGGIWTGPGADAFVEEVTSLIAPASVDIAGQLGQTVGAVQGAMQAIQDADKRATAVAADLADTFAAIF